MGLVTVKLSVSVIQFDLSVILSVKLDFINFSTVKLVNIAKIFVLFIDIFDDGGSGAGALIQFDVAKVGAVVGSSDRVQSLSGDENADENFHILGSISLKFAVIDFHRQTNMAAGNELKFSNDDEISRN